MPGWHEATRRTRDEGKIRFAGIIQEQHPDRCRLFMQWKEMRWPILVDSLNLLGVRAVPISVLIDEHGVVRGRVRRPSRSAKALEEFIGTDYPEPADLPPPASPPDVGKLRAAAEGASSAAAWMALGDALFLRGGPGDDTASVEAYRKAIDLGGPPEARFRLGVALRRRYESDARRDSDFQEAVAAWGKALALRPNQYIWRRRIQQYGPRLEKPYAFYDWVSEARKDILARGDTPPELRVEPRGAEIARRARTFESAPEGGELPDPEGRIRRDAKPLVGAEVTVVPATVRPGKSARVHVVLRPQARRKAHWNNEAGQLALWIDPPEGLEVDRRRLTAPNAKTPASQEARELEFEVRVDEDVKPGRLRLPAYAFYYVCEDVGGVCMYLRQDIEAGIEVR